MGTVASAIRAALLTGEVLEARGLDVTPATLERVRLSGDESGARILQRILDASIAHVGFGAKLFRETSRTRDEALREMWQNLVKTSFHSALKPPFNDSARIAGGLPRDWYSGIA